MDLFSTTQTHQLDESEYRFNSLHIIDFAIIVLCATLLTLTLIWWIIFIAYPSYKKHRKPADTSPDKKHGIDSKSMDTVEPYSPSVESPQSNTEVEANMYAKIQTDKTLQLYAVYLSTSHMIFVAINLWILVILGVIQISDRLHCIVFKSNLFFAFYARLFLYLYYMERTRRIFANSPLEINTFWYKIIIIWLVIGHTLAVVVYPAIMIPTSCLSDLKDRLLYIALAWPAFNDISTAIFCLVFFNMKLVRILRVTQSDKYDKCIAVDRMKTSMRKLTLLAIITIITTFVVAGMAMFIYSSLAIGGIVAAFCLILSFKFTEHIYEGICRRKCCSVENMCLCCCFEKHSDNETEEHPTDSL